MLDNFGLKTETIADIIHSEEYRRKHSEGAYINDIITNTIPSIKELRKLQKGDNDEKTEIMRKVPIFYQCKVNITINNYYSKDGELEKQEVKTNF